MSEPFVIHRKVYSLNGLAEEDVKLLCLGLDKAQGDLEQPSLDRAVKLINALKYALPVSNCTVSEDDG